MCGIYGTTILYKDHIVKEKLHFANFRGPDYTKYKLIDNKIYLGHNRLGIVDLDPRSNQPFTFLHINIVFNGEIYNYLELKAKLDSKFKFTTNSDTEVICAMYIEYGEDCLDYFNGMFSFVIYDSKKNIFFGARDRLGQKPFFYYHTRKGFEFASNLNQISYGNDSLELDRESCSDYFRFGYFIDPQTPYREIKKLMPGHNFVYDLSSNSLIIRQYWSSSVKKSNDASYIANKEKLKKLLADSINYRLSADVPVGLFLSGGIDSSLITAIASKVNPSLKTYSIKFDEDSYDESGFAEKIAKFLNTEHTTIPCTIKDSFDLIENFYQFYDEPFADISALPSMILSKKVKEHVTVALTGDGADEMFIGYERYKWMKAVEKFYNVPFKFRKTVSSVVRLLPNYKVKMLAQGISFKSLSELYLNLMSTFKGDYITDPISSNIQDVFYKKSNSLIVECANIDTKIYLNSDINTKVDRASMAFSLECRSPFMDYNVQEFSQQIPVKHKFKNGITKYILKDILSDYLPNHLYERPKMGFGVPLEMWLKKDLKELAYKSFEDFKKLNLVFIDYKKFEKLMNEFYSNKANHSVEIWKMIMFVRWHQRRKI